MPAKKNKNKPLVGKALVKEVNRRIRLARTLWDAHKNAACRNERLRALELYETLSEAEKEQVPQVLRVWLRYRSEKYFGEGRKGNGANSKE
ncbi:Precorrin-3B methylase [Roseibacillus ishigakijimensis]|uniref:Precorrin-3B methylase n=1 Tax=Roseibacillus ishigakijimensis TaxID=454146 RepID=A0A934RJE0_9BACT|nr:Precorrin-3B methylase [Roseibacillus ishigakijimensis]MBK1832747.1 Precorrin-3B methylase [Roseibacillus ishigakijimensis]